MTTEETPNKASKTLGSTTPGSATPIDASTTPGKKVYCQNLTGMTYLQFFWP